MERITIGASRRGGGMRAKRRRAGWAEAYFALGLLLAGAMLVFPLARGGAEEEPVDREAVAVMNVVAEPEVLRDPERGVPQVENRSVFDVIGSFFAGMIRGE